MPTIEDVFDKFSNDDFVGAKEDLTPMVRRAINDKMKEKLGLQNDPIEVEDSTEE